MNKKDQPESFDTRRLASLPDEAFIHHCFVRARRCICSPSRAKHYLTMLANGESREEVARSIIQENGSRSQKCSVTLRQWLLLFYKKVFRRQIDYCGLEYYPQRTLGGGELSEFVEFVYDFQSPIALKHIMRLVMIVNDDEFVPKAYRLILRREADAIGLAAYQQALRNGLSRVRILRSLAYSDEGRRFRKTLLVRLYLALGQIAK